MKSGIKWLIFILAVLFLVVSPFVLDWVRNPHIIDIKLSESGCGVPNLQVNAHGYSFVRQMPAGSVSLVETDGEKYTDYYNEETLQIHIGMYGPGLHRVSYFQATTKLDGARDGCVTDVTYQIWVPFSLDVPEVSFEDVINILTWER